MVLEVEVTQGACGRPEVGLRQPTVVVPALCGLLSQSYGQVCRPPAAPRDEGTHVHTEQHVRDPENHLHSLPG